MDKTILDENGLPNFGLNQLSIVDAATLVAICLYHNGIIESPEMVGVIFDAEGWISRPWNHAETKNALFKHASEYAQSIAKFVEANHITASKTSRWLTGEINPTGTYIDLDELYKWGELTDTRIEGYVLDEYNVDQANKFDELCLADRRFRMKQENPIFFGLSDLSREELEAKYEDIATKYLATPPLAPQKKLETDKSDSTPREKNTLLKIIAALDEMVRTQEKGEWSEKPYSDSEAIAAQMRELSLTNPAKRETICKWIKAARGLSRSN
ncbi:MAG: hypothetical protein P1U67_11625 [Alcanivoracaceae bacterium]|nr:hypothetical protein [Alcanivoracaceae bacterium]